MNSFVAILLLLSLQTKNNLVAANTVNLVAVQTVNSVAIQLLLSLHKLLLFGCTVTFVAVHILNIATAQQFYRSANN